jgi:hypothetical protein
MGEERKWCGNKTNCENFWREKASTSTAPWDFRLAFHPPKWVLAVSIPAVVSRILADADRRAAALASCHPPSPPNRVRRAKPEAFALRGGVLSRRETLAHFTGGRTLDMLRKARGERAAAAFALNAVFRRFHAAHPPWRARAFRLEVI